MGYLLHTDQCLFSHRRKIEKIRNRAKELLDAGIVDFIGSDAYQTYHCPPNIRRGIKALYETYDKDYVDRMVYRNVEELILGDET